MTTHAIRLPRLTAADTEALDHELAGARTAAAPSLALDLSAVVYLSSAALTRFVALDRELKAAGGRLSLRNVGPNVRRVLVVTRLDSLLNGCVA